MKNILCYGDSNTWGYVPGSYNPDTIYMERYPRYMRWTGILQKMLGENYFIIEDGLNGRTTNIDYIEQTGRNGKTSLPMSLYSHAPLDLVVIMLGINDLKNEFNRSPEEIARGIEELVVIINQSKFGTGFQSPPKILLVSTPIPAHEHYDADTFVNAIQRAKSLAAHIEKIANNYQCYFVDAASIKLTEIDGIHLDEDGHVLLAGVLHKELVSNVFS